MPVDIFGHLGLESRPLAPAQVLANRYQVLSRIGAGLAHEVKNPIHAAVINLELIRRRSDQPPLVMERADLLEADISRAYELVDALLALLGPDRSELGPIALDLAMARVMPLVDAYCRTEHTSASVCQEGEGSVLSTSSGLCQLLLNTVIHTVESLQPIGGLLEIRVTGTEDEIVISIAGSLREPGYEVAQTETLIGPEIRAEEFDPGLEVAKSLAPAAGALVMEVQPEGGAMTNTLIRFKRAGPGA